MDSQTKQQIMAITYLECDIENYVFNNPQDAQKKGFPALLETSRRQVLLPSGLRMDMLSWSIDDQDNLFIMIVEFKRGEIGLQALKQVSAYHTEVVLECYCMFKSVTIKVVLCGETISEDIDNICLMGTNIDAIAYKMGFDGISFRRDQESRDLVIPTVKERVRSETVFPDFLRAASAKTKELNELK